MRDWLGYDARGNVNNKNGHMFAFEHGNRLRTALGTETYRYDAHGRRVRTSSTAGTLYEMYSLEWKLLWQMRRAARAALPAGLSQWQRGGDPLAPGRGGDGGHFLLAQRRAG